MSGEREIKTGKISVSKSSFLKLPQLFYAVANIYRFPNPAKTWISRCCTLYNRTDRTPAKIQITDEGNPGAEFKTLILENVSAIQKRASKSKHFKVEIHWRKERFSFAVDSEYEANSWIDHLNEVADFDNKTNKKILVDSVSNSSSISENDVEVFVNNTDYQSLDMWTYDVEMNDTEASLRCELSGPYRLQLTKQGFFLLTFKERSVLYQWPYHFIRRYGKGQNTFTIQAGRKCESGEGSFCFGTKAGENLEIFQSVNQLTLQLKASQTELATDNSPVPRGVAKPNMTSETKPSVAKPNMTSETKPILPRNSVEIPNQHPPEDSSLWAKKAPPYQMELQHKLYRYTDKYSNMSTRKPHSPDIQPPKIPLVVKPQNFYNEVELVSGKTSNLSINPNANRNNYSLLEVNNNHGSRNVPTEEEDDYDQLDFNLIETPSTERQKNFQPYVYDSIVVKSEEEEENVYEEAAPFTDERNACGGKMLPVPVVVTHKPFMAPATIDDGYR